MNIKRLIKEASVGIWLLVMYVAVLGFAVPYFLNIQDNISVAFGAFLGLCSVVSMPIVGVWVYEYFKTTYFSSKESN